MDNCFVIMPYGMKEDIDGNEVDFEVVYKFIIKQAVARVPGLNCVRCDDIELPGWIHDRMLRHILDDAVAIVDTSTLNANVFYELGVRHALKRCVTVLIHKKGTSWPFNIAGMSSVEYTLDLSGADEAKEKIGTFITNGLKDAKHVDSLVYNVLPELQMRMGPARVPKVLTKCATIERALVNGSKKRLGLVTGDRDEITVGDIWVNSENTEMQMDRYYGTSTSATIRYLGAEKNAVSGRVERDTIAEELKQRMGSEKQVDPGFVITTGAGSLEKNNNVRYIFHVAAVIGEPREGYRPIERVERCVTNALRRADKEFRREQVKSILFPIFGTGPGGGDFKDHANKCFNAAIEYLETNPTSSMERVYFYVWSDLDLELCMELLEGLMQHGRLTTV